MVVMNENWCLNNRHIGLRCMHEPFCNKMYSMYPFFAGDHASKKEPFFVTHIRCLQFYFTIAYVNRKIFMVRLKLEAPTHRPTILFLIQFLVLIKKTCFLWRWEKRTQEFHIFWTRIFVTFILFVLKNYAFAKKSFADS